MAKRFLESVLLDQVREDIRENRTLNVHYFNALRKATFRPEAFFKGLIFPLIESSTCTLREAHIISGVLTRAALPVLHSAAALMRLTDIISEQASASNESGGAANIFIKALLLKQYALPSVHSEEQETIQWLIFLQVQGYRQPGLSLSSLPWQFRCNG